jgi:hypothetical protein
MSMIESDVTGSSAFRALGVPGAFNGEEPNRYAGPWFDDEDTRSKSKFEWTSPLSRQAAGKTVSPLPENDSAHDELLARRDQLADIGRKNPTTRLAAFLVAIVHLNPDQGSSELVISEKTDSHFVADLLGFSMDDLVKHLLQFKAQGLVTPMPNGSLRITNLAALERMADGDALPQDADASQDLTEVHRIIVEPPRVYTRSTTEAVSLSQFDNAVRYDVVSMTTAACLVVALAVAFGIVVL